MKVVILAGGHGTRISEETGVRPKPMVEIGGRPILWHIMKHYAAHGVQDFLVCCGYKAHVIKEYFASYFLQNSDVTFDMETNEVEVHQKNAEPWRVTVVDTGLDTLSGGRLKRVRSYLGGETFCFTYGDNVSDVNIRDLVAHHRAQGVLATVTAVQPPGRFGVFQLAENDDLVRSFREKPRGDGAWINGGFFVLEPGAIDFIAGDETPWEQEPLTELARRGQLAAYRHRGFWQNMDTLRDKHLLESLWQGGNAPWKTW